MGNVIVKFILGIVSDNLLRDVKSFVVDSKKEWTPFSFKKISKDNFDKKPSDHCAIMLSLNVTRIKEQNKKVPIINFKNPQGWARYAEISDNYANKMEDLIENEEDIDTLQRKLESINTDIMLDSFGVIWINQGKSKKQKKRDDAASSSVAE